MDLEGLQHVDATPGHMLHPTAHFYGQELHRDRDSIPPGAGNLSAVTQHYPVSQDGPTYPSPTKEDKTKFSSPEPVPGDADFNLNNLATDRKPASEPRILGLRRTTFFLTVSNILLAIGLVVLGVVQSRVLKDGGGASTAQTACLE